MNPTISPFTQGRTMKQSSIGARKALSDLIKTEAAWRGQVARQWDDARNEHAALVLHGLDDHVEDIPDNHPALVALRPITTRSGAFKGILPDSTRSLARHGYYRPEAPDRFLIRWATKAADEHARLATYEKAS